MIQAYRENIDILTPEFIDDLLWKIKTLDAKYKTLEEMGIDSELGDVFSQVINHEISLCLQKYWKNWYDEWYFQSLVHCANMYWIRLNGIKNLSY